MRRALFVLAFFAFAFAGAMRAFAGQTPPNTTIQNTASATYKDSNGNSYTTESNTVTTIVQNAPSLTVTTNNGSSAGSQNVAPGQVVSDTYTLTNTGNASGNFALTTGASDNGVQGAGNDDSNTSSVQYIYNSTTYTTVAALNTALAAASATTSGSSITIQVQYTLSASPANVPGTVTTQLKATIAYAAVGSAGAVTSAAVSNTYSDAVQSDARMDMQKTSAQGGASPYNITYTINANNGGAFGAQQLNSVTALGFPTKGCLAIVDKLPTYGATPPSIVGTPTLTYTAGTNGFPASGVTATVYYTTSANGSSGWTTSAPANPTYIAVFLSVSSGTTCLNSHAGTSTGSVTNAQAAVQLQFVMPQPSGAGSGNANAYQNVATSIFGDNQPTEHITGGNIPAGTADSGGAAPIYAASQGVNLAPVIPPGAGSSGGNGWSNTTVNNAHLAAGVFNGPSSSTPTTMSTLVTTSQATGSYDGSVAVNANNDFTQMSFTPNAFTSINSSTTIGSPTGNTYTSAVNGINVPNAIYNSGNKDDSYTVAVTAPAGGWTVQLFPDNGSGTGPSGSAYAGCTSPAASCTATVAVSSGQAIQYWAVYNAPSGVATFTRFDGSIVATSVNDNTQTNTTHNELYSGYIALTKSVTVTSSGCPAGTSPSYGAGALCPGGVLTYSIDYRNIAVTGGSGNTEPANALLSTKAGQLVITDDGAAIGNTWAANTNGLNAAATDTPGGGGTWNATDVWGTNTVGSSKFTLTVGGASFQLGAGQFGTIAFSVTVK
ncbi:MAG TPA: hypothetical protein VGZ02_09935 [Candidatus Baltobacteraceae bacterium]|jgi:hypothetical protein|nr:hypothetical protein [Candidatus Baltobacteraceae bacterium]